MTRNASENASGHGGNLWLITRSAGTQATATTHSGHSRTLAVMAIRIVIAHDAAVGNIIPATPPSR